MMQPADSLTFQSFLVALEQLGTPDSISAAKRMGRVTFVYERAVEVLENQESAWNCLNRANPALGEAVSLDLLATEEGAEQVKTLLGRIEYGVYS
jgi:putative toxin-antitoxin system antitoxin component (TIGR02293 family)